MSDSAGRNWRTSSFSQPNGNECVEISVTTRVVRVRDTKDRTAALAFPVHAWTIFVKR